MPAIQASRPVKIVIDGGYGKSRELRTATEKPMPSIRKSQIPKIQIHGKLPTSTYAAPTMAQVNEARGSNGYSAASLFAGGGGSSTGWALAGFKVLWANEFMDHAATTYRANHPDTIVDQRTIRDVQPDDILEAIGLKAGDLDVLDGSPPCDSFSTAGVRQKAWGKEKEYYGGKKHQRTDDLFFEYVRILDGLRPRMFIAENVTGLIKGAAKGRFLQILKALKGVGYHVEVKVLDAQWLGVPQCRQRVIFQGSRDGEKLFWPKPHRKRISLAEAIGAISGFTNIGFNAVKFSAAARPNPTITTSTSKKMGGQIVPGEGSSLAETGQPIGHYAIGEEWKKLKPGESSDRFFNLVRPDPKNPSPCVSGSAGLFPSGASVTHPSEPRKFTIPELKAVCSFPPDYKLTGTYGDQWAVCGMSVPPLMMFEIAKGVQRGLDHLKGLGLK